MTKYPYADEITSCKLIGYTQPDPDLDIGVQNIKEIVAYCARVSNPSNQMNHETSDRLLDYLIRHKHWSPFQMAHVTLEIVTTRDIARQLLRHQSLSGQEHSQRYSDGTDSLGFVLREARLQDHKNRQNSLETDDERLKEEWELTQTGIIQAAKHAYDWAIANGIAKEQARSVLPEGNTVSRLYAAGSIRSFIHYLQVRTEEGTQKEHRLLALKIAEAITKVFPFDIGVTKPVE